VCDIPKNNKCSVLFFCSHTEKDPCVNFFGKGEKCDYCDKNYNCNSAVAAMNKIITELKESGIECAKK